MDTPILERDLEIIFDSLWPILAFELSKIREPATPTPPKRPERELWEEMLARVREIDWALDDFLRRSAGRQGALIGKAIEAPGLREAPPTRVEYHGNVDGDTDIDSFTRRWRGEK